MTRAYIPIGLIIIFAFWVLYHLLIKKDLRKHANSFYLGLFFIGVWAVLYCWMRD
jgi:hypothetical protein